MLSGILIVIFIIGLIYTYTKPALQSSAQDTSQKHTANTSQPSKSDNSQEDKIAFIQVDIKGAVNHPGVYRLPLQSRAADGIRAAGGLSPNADASSINLAAVLLDGSEMIVPSAKNAVTASASDPNSHDGKVDLNTATASELDALPGIGPTRAQQIVQYRETHGLYQSVQDLLNIEGFGPKLLEKIKDQITIQ